ncbi:hypothetical protein, partial [Akkermansia sp.]|uniref:hypothetical protein n=1 Tax=Akkermansia sp. TaxID=1872421 RepID=UPI00284352B9
GIWRGKALHFFSRGIFVMRKDEEVLTKKLLFNGIFIFSECGGLMISVCRRTEATWKKATDSKSVPI